MGEVNKGIKFSKRRISLSGLAIDDPERYGDAGQDSASSKVPVGSQPSPAITLRRCRRQTTSVNGIRFLGSRCQHAMISSCNKGDVNSRGIMGRLSLSVSLQYAELRRRKGSYPEHRGGGPHPSYNPKVVRPSSALRCKRWRKHICQWLLSTYTTHPEALEPSIVKCQLKATSKVSKIILDRERLSTLY